MNRYTAATGPSLYPDKTSTRYRCMECLLSAQDAFSCREPARQSYRFSSHSTTSSELQTILDSDWSCVRLWGVTITTFDSLHDRRPAIVTLAQTVCCSPEIQQLHCVLRSVDGDFSLGTAVWNLLKVTSVLENTQKISMISLNSLNQHFLTKTCFSLLPVNSSQHPKSPSSSLLRMYIAGITTVTDPFKGFTQS